MNQISHHHFIIENAGNTCYIDSLLFSLFMLPAAESLLRTQVDGALAIYLQEYIKTDFIEKIRCGKSVLINDMIGLRELCFQNGWKSSEDSSEIYGQQDVNEFYAFILETLKGTMLEIRRDTYMDDIHGKILDNTKSCIDKMPFIPLSIPESGFVLDQFTGLKQISVNNMIQHWMYNNFTEVKRTVSNHGITSEKIIPIRNTYTIANEPLFIGFSINRFITMDQRDCTQIDINAKIKFNCLTNGINSVNKWIFHAAICHKGDSIRSGHYYSLIENSGNYILFDDLMKPSICKADMSDIEFVTMIKLECVFLIYRLAF